MEQREFNTIIRKIKGILKGIIFSMVLLLVLIVYIAQPTIPPFTKRSSTTIVEKRPKPAPEIVDGIHVRTGLKEGAGLQLVIQNCTSCHSSKLIVQNRMKESGWRSTIKWMQQTQNLWDLGESEDVIVKYLATMYAPQKKGRRAQLTNIEWYELD